MNRKTTKNKQIPILFGSCGWVFEPHLTRRKGVKPTRDAKAKPVFSRWSCMPSSARCNHGRWPCTNDCFERG